MKILLIFIVALDTVNAFVLRPLEPIWVQKYFDKLTEAKGKR